MYGNRKRDLISLISLAFCVLTIHIKFLDILASFVIAPATDKREQKLKKKHIDPDGAPETKKLKKKKNLPDSSVSTDLKGHFLNLHSVSHIAYVLYYI